MILDLALKRGLRPILGGRDSERLMALAQTTGLSAVTVSIDEIGRDDSAFADVGVVLNAAGLYSLTGPPLRRLFLDAGLWGGPSVAAPDLRC